MTRQCDPESARSLLCNPLLQGKLVMIPLDITHLALATGDIRSRLLGDRHPLRQMFYDLLMFFAGTYRDVFGFADGPPLHDPLAIAVILDMLGIEGFGFEDGETIGEKGAHWKVDVVTAGKHEDVHHGNDRKIDRESQLGRIILVRQAAEQEGGVRIPRRIKRLDRFWDAIELSMQKAETVLEGIDVRPRP